jgi:proteasome component ECM29
MALARALTGVLTRRLEAGGSATKGADTMLKNVLPFLLSPSGLESSAEEVRAFALSTLLQIIKSSTGKILRPYVPELVGRLIALLSSVEPAQINYLRLHADEYGVTTQQLDDARLTAVRASPMMEAIERCLDFLDEATMKELQSTLENAIKVALGLPSKVGATRILVSLATRHSFVFKDHADHFLKFARKQVLDRNETVSSSYAAACGYLARLASDEEILKLIDFAKTMYFDSEDERHRAIAGDIIFATSKHATDRFNALAGDVLPFVFVAKHDPYERAKVFFKDTWNENVGGSRAVLLYLKEIISLAFEYLDSPRWSLKHTSAFAVADVIDSSGTEISDSNAQIIWPALENALGGKTWDGKETVLKSFITFAKTSTLLATNEATASQMQKIIIREVKRNNPRYRQYALACLGDFVELRDTVDLYPQVSEIANPVISDALGDADDMDIDERSGGPSSKSITEETLANAAAALLKSINPKSRSGAELVTSLSQTLETIVKVTAGSGSRIVHNAILDAQKSLFAKLELQDSATFTDALEDVLVEYVKVLFSAWEGVEQTRLKRAEVAVAMVALCRKSGRLGGVLAAVREGVEGVEGRERSVGVKQVLGRAGKGGG